MRKIDSRLRWLGSFAVAALCLSACGGGKVAETPSPPPSTAPTTLGAAANTPAQATAAPSPLFANAQGGSPLEWATRLLQSVSPADTSYKHQDGRVAWAGVKGAPRSLSNTDCSGLINALLKQSFGLTNGQFKSWLSTERPLAKDYYNAIVAAKGFTRVTNVTDLRPGDLISVRYTNSAPGDDTGHIMVVTAAATPRTPSQPLRDGESQWDVSIIDSATSGHGPTDTRSEGSNKFREGLGQGILRLYADATGAITGYTWSDLAASDYYGTSDRPLAAGRLNPAFSPS